MVEKTEVEFVVLARDEDGYALIQFDSKRDTLLYTAKKSQGDRWFKAAIPQRVLNVDATAVTARSPRSVSARKKDLMSPWIRS